MMTLSIHKYERELGRDTNRRLVINNIERHKEVGCGQFEIAYEVVKNCVCLTYNFFINYSNFALSLLINFFLIFSLASSKTTLKVETLSEKRITFFSL